MEEEFPFGSKADDIVLLEPSLTSPRASSFEKQAYRKSSRQKTFCPAWTGVLKFYLKKLKFPVSKYKYLL